MQTPDRTAWTFPGRIVARTIPLLALLGATPGRADPTVYYHAGAWHAFTDKDAAGRAICGIGTDKPADGRTLLLTYTVGGSDLTIAADKSTWNIPDGTALQISLQVDQNPPAPAQAAGHGTSVGWVVPAASIRAFDTQFRNGGVMTITFPSGNEAPWTLSLAGSSAASATLWRCVQDLSDRAHITSPVSNMPPPTQPFGQAPTQPYTPAAPTPTQTPAATPAPTTKP